MFLLCNLFDHANFNQLPISLGEHVQGNISKLTPDIFSNFIVADRTRRGHGRVREGTTSIDAATISIHSLCKILKWHSLLPAQKGSFHTWLHAGITVEH